MTDKSLQLPPDSSRLIESLRSTGYDFNSAVADLIDNSIAAEATRVAVQVEGNSEETLAVYIADNGYGMNSDELLNAMTYGSRVRDDKKSLGKFGLGLKTASSAICRSYSVASRSRNSTQIVKACWDIDHVVKQGSWDLLLPPLTDHEDHCLQDIAEDGSGTIVSWHKVDRLFESKEAPGTGSFSDILTLYVQRLSFHLSAIFQRFIDPEDDRVPTVEITVNNRNLLPWDPFYRNEPETIAGERTQIRPPECDNDMHGEVVLQSFVLPRAEQFEHERHTGRARLTPHFQGFYVYREHRLIQRHDWLGLLDKEPGLTLLRCELSFGAELDDLFHVDIMKSRLVLSEAFKAWLDSDFIDQPIKKARKRFTLGQRLKALKSASTAHDDSNRRIALLLEQLHTVTVNQYLENNRGSAANVTSAILSLSQQENFIVPIMRSAEDELYTPTAVDGRIGIELNTAHPFYTRAYLPRINESVTVQTLDALLFALVQAELSISDKEGLADRQRFRREVSKAVAAFVKDLPDPLL